MTAPKSPLANKIASATLHVSLTFFNAFSVSLNNHRDFWVKFLALVSDPYVDIPVALSEETKSWNRSTDFLSNCSSPGDKDPDSRRNRIAIEFPANPTSHSRSPSLLPSPSSFNVSHDQLSTLIVIIPDQRRDKNFIPDVAVRQVFKMIANGIDFAW